MSLTWEFVPANMPLFVPHTSVKSLVSCYTVFSLMLLCQVRLCSQWFSETVNNSLLKKKRRKSRVNLPLCWLDLRAIRDCNQWVWQFLLKLGCRTLWVVLTGPHGWLFHFINLPLNMLILSLRQLLKFIPCKRGFMETYVETSLSFTTFVYVLYYVWSYLSCT